MRKGGREGEEGRERGIGGGGREGRRDGEREGGWEPERNRVTS